MDYRGAVHEFLLEGRTLPKEYYFISCVKQLHRLCEEIGKELMDYAP